MKRDDLDRYEPDVNEDATGDEFIRQLNDALARGDYHLVQLLDRPSRRPTPTKKHWVWRWVKS